MITILSCVVGFICMYVLTLLSRCLHKDIRETILMILYALIICYTLGNTLINFITSIIGGF